MGGSGRFDVFTDLVLFDTSGASGGHIFRCTTKDMGERRAKGAAAPDGSPGVMLTGFAESARREFALVPRPNFNQGWRSAYPHPFVPTAVRQKLVGSTVSWAAQYA